MKLTVIIPVLNEEAVIAPFLTSLRRMCPACEVIVADGGSDDGTAERARAQAIVLSVSSSRGASLNAAASAATGDVLLFLHADSQLPPGAVDAVARALDDVGVIGGAFRLEFDDTGWAATLAGACINARARLFNTFFGDQAMFVRRDVFLRAGGFREWSLMEDLEILSRLRRRGRLVIVDQVVRTSARRHRRDGWLRTIARVWIITILHRFGVRSEVLRRAYMPRREAASTMVRP